MLFFPEEQKDITSLQNDIDVPMFDVWLCGMPVPMSDSMSESLTLQICINIK